MTYETLLTQTIQTSGVLRCLECGKCTAICPIARYDGGFSPRVTVGRALAGGDEELLRDDRLWTCLSCLQCSQVCPANVDYAALTAAVRVAARRQGQVALCTHGEAVHTWMRMMSQPGLKQNRVQWLLDSGQCSVSSLQSSEDGKQPTTNSSITQHLHCTERSEVQVSPNHQSPITQSPNHQSPITQLPITSLTSDTLYFAGCAPHYDALFAPLGIEGKRAAQSSIRLLNAIGIQPQVLADERCCGHDLLWEGDVDRFLQLARLNADQIRAAGVKRIVSACPECVRALKVDYAAHGIRLNAEVVHISELLVGSKVLAGSKTPTNFKNVTYHDPCRLGRHLGVYDAPRKVLEQIGYQVVEMKHNRRNATCCGTNGWTHCGAANKAIQVQRLREAKATGADAMVTACLKCQIHFKCALMDRSLRDEIGIEMVDLATLVASRI